MCLGNFCMGFFLSFLINFDLGVDPYTCMMLGISGRIGLTYGSTVAMCNVILLLPALLRKRSLISFGTLFNMFLNGYICDFFRWVWAQTLPADFFAATAVRWGGMILVLPFFIVGAAAYMASDTGMAPFDALPFVITDLVPRLPFTPVRMACDIVCVVVGFLLGATVGPVTVLMAFCVGPVIRLVKKYIDGRFEAWDAKHPPRETV